jgi:hypothetical protein
MSDRGGWGRLTAENETPLSYSLPPLLASSHPHLPSRYGRRGRVDVPETIQEYGQLSLVPMLPGSEKTQYDFVAQG